MQDILLCGLQIYSRVSFGKAQKENNPPLKYILQQALDALNPNDPEVTKLTAELKCPPSLSHYATLSEWQFGLDKLLNYSKILKTDVQN